MDERTTVQAGARARVNGAAKQWLSLAAVVLGVAVIAVPAAPASAEDELCGVEVCVGCDSSGPFEFSAGPDQYVADGSAVQLAGVASGSDQVCVDPGPAVWSQVGGQSVTLSDTSSLTPTFTAPEVEFFGETLTFRLTYADHTDDVDITINDDDPLEVLTGCEGPPFQLSAGPDQTVDEGTPVQLAGVAQGAFACVSTQPAVWTQVDGPTVSLTNDYLVPTFTASAGDRPDRPDLPSHL